MLPENCIDKINAADPHRINKINTDQAQKKRSVRALIVQPTDQPTRESNVGTSVSPTEPRELRCLLVCLHCLE